MSLSWDLGQLLVVRSLGSTRITVITVKGMVVTNQAECIHCSACVKKCPTGARKWESAFIDEIRKWLTENCRQRKEPEIYL